MKRYYYITFVLLLTCFSCKEKQKESPISKEINVIEIEKDALEKKVISSIDFNEVPISIKDFTLNGKEFWVTSSMINTKNIDSTLCEYKDYHLIRGYNILNKKNDEIINQLNVFVVDNDNKWNRKKAKEEFLSFDVNDESIKLWKVLSVGMLKNSLLEKLQNVEYHEDFGLITVYSKIFEVNFYFQSDIINKIKINRRCLNYSKQQLLKINDLDSIYILSNKLSPNYIKADFNGDKKEDVAYLIEEIESKKVGLIFFHDINSYFVVGAGVKFNDDLDDMNWLDILELNNNKIQNEMLFDDKTFDIIGDREVIIPNIGISIREEEGSGGLLFFKEGKYNYLHQGD